MFAPEDRDFVEEVYTSTVLPTLWLQRHFMYKPLNNNGFTLIEIVIVIVVLGILAATSVPRFQDLATKAKESEVRQALGELRTAISVWTASNIAKGGSLAYPSIDSLRTYNVVLASKTPPNAFQHPDSAQDSIVTGVTRGVIVGTRGGWAYKPSTGEIWPNTNTTVGAGSGCDGPTTLGENEW